MAPVASVAAVAIASCHIACTIVSSERAARLVGVTAHHASVEGDALVGDEPRSAVQIAPAQPEPPVVNAIGGSVLFGLRLA